MTAASSRRRLAAILSADAAGYSRLMAEDDRATLRALDAARSVFRRKIETHQGRVIDTAGDSILAAFETAIGAVAAALTAQPEIDALANALPNDRRLRFRIGIHLGDVIEKADGTVYGDGVNIAARLQGLAEPGGITVSESIREAVKGKVGATFEDQGQQTVKNITDPVRAYRVRPLGGREPSAPAAATQAPPSGHASDLSLPDKPSIAVLPFLNMSSDPEQEFFADGITEDIITEISRFRSLLVIARNSTFTYKGKAVDVRRVAKELGVRYVLEGSVRKSANRIRVTAQLIDALSGVHIWAQKYDRVLEDIFAVQEELTQSIIVAIAPAIDGAVAMTVRRRPASASAYEMGLRAQADLRDANRNADPALFEAGIATAREALAIDANNPAALRAVAWARWLQLFNGTATDRAAVLNEGLAAAKRLIDVDAANAQGHSIKGLLLIEMGLVDEAVAISRYAHELNANDMQTLQGLAYAELCAGNAPRAIAHLQWALRISPLDPGRWTIHAWLAAAYYFAKEYALAMEKASIAAAEEPRHPAPHTTMAVAWVGLGDIAKAKAALEVARRLGPEFVERRLRGEMPYRNAEHRHRHTVFLRIAAGVEDASAADALR